MSDWQPISTAPMGKPILLFLDPPLNTADACGWVPERDLDMVVGWGEIVRYTTGDQAEFRCGLCEEGSADTEGYSSAIQMDINPTHWMPLPATPK